MAIMEGETEIYLTEQQALVERFNDVPLWIRPQSFFQTNPAVASRLYATARDWVRQLPVWYMDIDTTAKYKSGVTTVKDSVRLDPWVFMFSAGYRF